MTADLHLAIAHHLLFLLLAGVLAFEIGVVRPKMDREDILRVARVDIWYGVLAGAIILVGFSRAIFAAKGGPTTPSTCFSGRNLVPSPSWVCCQSCPR
jgi:putative membrane protein